MASIKSELRDDAEILDFTANPMGGNVKYRTGDRAAGFQFGTGFDGLQPVKVTLVGTGKLKDNVFPIATLQDDAAAKLTAAVAKKAGAGFEIQSMTLGMSPVTGEVQLDRHRRGRRPPAGLPGRRGRDGPQEDLLSRA